MLASLLLLGTLVWQEEDVAGLVYGTDVAFAIDAPKGWILDNTSGKREGLPAVMYPNGSAWATSDAVVYVNLNTKESGDTLETSINADIAEYKERTPKGTVTREKDILTGDERRARVYRFTGAGPDGLGVESIAFIDTPKSIVILAYSARSMKAFKQHRQALDYVVKSFKFLTTKVNLRGKP